MEATMTHSGVGWLVKIAHMGKELNVLLTKYGRRKIKETHASKTEQRWVAGRVCLTTGRSEVMRGLSSEIGPRA
jgi:hypothetical protein